jgi:hypothetical protein
VVEHLPPKQALTLARQIEADYSRSRALAELVPRLPPEQQAEVLQEALAVARLIEDGYYRSWVLAGLVPRLPPEQQSLPADEAVTAFIDGIGDVLDDDHAMRSVASMLAKRPLAQADHSWARLLHQMPLHGRSDWLGHLTDSLPLLEHLGGQQALLELKNAILNVTSRWS